MQRFPFSFFFFDAPSRVPSCRASFLFEGIAASSCVVGVTRTFSLFCFSFFTCTDFTLPSQKKEWYHIEPHGRCTKTSLLNGPEKVLRIEVWYFGKQIPMPLSFNDSVPADCLGRWSVAEAMKRISNVSLSATTATKVVLRSAWPAFHPSTGRPVSEAFLPAKPEVYL